MSRGAPFLFAGLAATLLAFGVVADRALVGQGRTAREAAEAGADEAARLTALSVRATLAQIEQAVAAGRTVEGVTSDRLAIPPHRVAVADAVPYGRRPRSELAKLLRSTEVTASGLPQAVVARIALGGTAVTTGEVDAAPDVGERLLAGELPVSPDDLPYLAAVLGKAGDPRVVGLQRRLREAPDAARLPAVPGFRRRLLGGNVEGWSRRDAERLRYQVPVRVLLDRAGVSGRASPADASRPPGDGRRIVAVPDVDGLALSVAPETPGSLRLRALRVVLWTAVVASLLGVVTIRRAVAREARANAREKAFLTGVTHELRAPLAAIRLFGETLAEGRGDPREYGTLVAQETERLEVLVERVLAATRLDGDEALSFGRLDARELLRSAVELIRPRAERRSVTVHSPLDGDLPEVLWDGEAVRRALLNLLDNAIQHGRQGGRVEVRAGLAGDDVRLSVADDGPGVGAAHRKRIFGRFHRGATSAPGTGLGLYLVDQVARAHGGRVDLETEEERGATFTLVLPVVPPGARPTARQS